MSENIIEVKGLNKSFKKYSRDKGLFNAFKSLFKREYKTIKAVDNVSFNVKKGEILGYLGPNGAGKSTVIKMLTGILYPDKGEVNALGYNPWEDREDYVKNIGVVLGQKSTLWWDLPAIDTYELNKDIYEIPEDDFKKRLEELTELLEVKDITRTPVRKLSLGQRMRCEFINSMLHKPKILFLDEPTIGVDIVAKRRIREFIKKINKEDNITIILTTHDIKDVEELCSRIIIIDKGRHIYEGSIEALKNKYIKNKKLIIEFDEEVKGLKIPNCKMVKKEGVRVELLINTSKTSVSEVVKSLINKFTVNDFEVKEEDVESVIRKIYEEKTHEVLG